MNCICPECGKEIIPIINAVPNVNGANPLPIATHLDLVFDANPSVSHPNVINNTGCAAQPTFSNWHTVKF